MEAYKTETYTIEKDIKVLTLTATTFPQGVHDAHEKLHEILPDSGNRIFFGISRPENGGEIVYKAAAEERQADEAEKYGLETFIIKKGNYIGIFLKDYWHDVSTVAKAFDQLLHTSGIDPEGYCLEWYVNERDVRCLVPLKW